MTYGIGQQCCGGTMPSCAPWTPRHCSDCGACETATGAVYSKSNVRDHNGDAPKGTPQVCLACLRSWQNAQPVQESLGLGR